MSGEPMVGARNIVCLRLVNGALRIKAKDQPITPLLCTIYPNGCCIRMAGDWNAMTIKLEHHLVISGKFLFVKRTDGTALHIL